jgi:hypothetical protein
LKRNSGLVVPLSLVPLGGGLLLGLRVMGLGHSRRRDPTVTEIKGGKMAFTSLASSVYPVRLDGSLDAPLNRWKWLLKWILVVPHAILLMVLWLAVIPLTILAGFSILFTGRYPQSIFHFTVGVMRWTWRVAFYAFSALATDQYPPFSLEPDDLFPAAFDVDYPQQLSRGLVLVKWWLLAIPQYIIVGVLMGGGLSFAGRMSSNWSFATGGGVRGLLVLVAGFVLLFTGRYSPAIFDFVMGLNRWCYRVLAYVLLLRDEYPPFRFDAGGVDPGSAGDSSPAPAPSSPGPVFRAPLHQVDW